MTFNNLQALATAAIFASYGRCSDMRAAAFEGTARNMLFGATRYIKDGSAPVATVTFTLTGKEYTIQQNLTQGTYTIINIENA
jgi:hypothetical protein